MARKPPGKALSTVGEELRQEVWDSGRLTALATRNPRHVLRGEESPRIRRGGRRRLCINRPHWPGNRRDARQPKVLAGQPKRRLDPYKMAADLFRCHIAQQSSSEGGFAIRLGTELEPPTGDLQGGHPYVDRL
jgi:hypothetical protein